MGSVTVIFLPFLPIVYLIMFFGNLFGTSTGANVTEVALPYNEDTGLVWKCEKTDYDWFELSETRIEGDSQIFIFEAKGGESYCDAVVFTAENGEELVYRARDVSPVFPTYGKVKLYAPDEYIIYDYVPKPKNKVDNARWSRTASGTQADDYCLNKTEVDGETVFRVICFEDISFSHSYRYFAWNSDQGSTTYEGVTVRYKYTKENGLKIEEYSQIYSQEAQ